ncbi:MAG: sulfurtransferase TusA family protein [Nitrososphaerales archaeon]|jgi:TusA-related sulfurtransferase
MTSENLESVKPDEIMDVLGETCPYPQLYTKKKLEKMAAGSVLEVITDHPPAAEETIPGYCRDMKYPYVVKKEGAVYKIIVRKTKTE